MWPCPRCSGNHAMHLRKHRSSPSKLVHSVDAPLHAAECERRASVVFFKVHRGAAHRCVTSAGALGVLGVCCVAHAWFAPTSTARLTQPRDIGVQAQPASSAGT
jgi:hypothetical protein